MTTNTDSIKSKIKKLLRHAADRQGQPEAEIYYTKAFDLMARYGIEQAHLDNADTTAKHQVIKFTGAYTDRQMRLLNALAQALHCAIVVTGIPNSSRFSHADLFGAKHHLERVTMLFSMLNPIMLTGANKEYQARKNAGTIPFGLSAVMFKKSWMLGFSNRACDRLVIIEKSHQSEYGTSTQSGELVLLSDLDKATALRKEMFPDVEEVRRKIRSNTQAVQAGQAAANNVDLGQDRVGTRQAIEA